jgi:glycosyltransferase involved in cell wall biosynthesis
VKILQVLAADTTGGTETGTALQSERMRARGELVEVAFLDARGPIAARLHAAGIPTHSLGPGIAKASVRLARMLIDGDFDVINAYGFKAATIVRAALALRRRRPAFVHGVMGLHITEVVELDEPKGRLAFALERLLQSRVDVYEVNSLGAMEYLPRNGIASHRMIYVPNAIDTAAWRVPRREPRGGPLVGLCAARFVERKRQVDIIRAVELLDRRGVSIEMRFVGDGELLEECRALAERIGVGDRCRFLGRVDHREMPGMMSSCDVFVLASVWEGMSGAALEAMASGLPIVGTDVSGISDLFVDGESGLAVPVRDPDALADALARLAQDAAGRRRMGEAAAARVGELHDIERWVDQKLEIYRTAVAARAATVRNPMASSSKG